MESYIHTWKDVKTGEVCKTGEGKIATTLDEAISDYYQEIFAYEYDHTIVLNHETSTFAWLDIEEEIVNRQLAERSPYQVADDAASARADHMRRDA